VTQALKDLQVVQVVPAVKANRGLQVQKAQLVLLAHVDPMDNQGRKVPQEIRALLDQMDNPVKLVVLENLVQLEITVLKVLMARLALLVTLVMLVLLVLMAHKALKDLLVLKVP